MKSGLRVAAPPPGPLLVFDGDCHFCRLWIGRWRQLTGGSVDYLPSQDARIAGQFPEIPPARFAEAVQFIDADGTVYGGAEAVFRTLAHNPRWQRPLHWYEDSLVFARVTERGYRLVAEHRPLFSRLTRWGWGQHVEAPQHFLVRWLFLRGLGLVYLAAFLSLWTQVDGLMGHEGILPVDQFMPALKQTCDTQGIGWERYHLVPTLCWLDASNSFLNLQCAAGVVLALLLIAGVAPAPSLFLLWLLYLSLVTVGRDFFAFQWDGLLLETGLLAFFWAPWQLWPRPARETPPSRLFLWLLRLLLFKLMFLSGCVKLLSGDPAWRHLTALTFHYHTQPLPPWTAWYAQQWPLWFQKVSCAFVLGTEVAAPFLIFTPRRLRCLGAGLLAVLQVLILLTGNYTFFNWLTLLLCLLLPDDWMVGARIPGTVRGWLVFGTSARTPPLPRQWPRPAKVTVAVIVLAASSFTLVDTLGMSGGWLAPIGWVAGQLEPLRCVNGYGLFRVMTTERDEIIVEGSADGVDWRPYEFRYKPGDVSRRPAFVAPFQPRLDWQMWFAALGSPAQNAWFGNLCDRLLQGSPDVEGLLAKNPFPNRPPRFIRAEFYNYQFTDSSERRRTGAWWQRKWVGEYLPSTALAPR